MNIKELIKVHHGAMVDKGFYDCPDPVHKKDDYQGYCSTCLGQNINPNKNIGELIMLIVTELSEAVEADRIKKHADFKSDYHLNIENVLPPGCDGSYFNHPQIYINAFEREIKDTFEDEIADTYLRLYDLCGYLDIVPNEVRGSVNWRTKNTADRLRQISKKVLDLNPDYPKDNDFKTALGFIFLYLDVFCEGNGIPISKHREAKIAYNKTRKHLHGKEY
jgi:hypothetical protein